MYIQYKTSWATATVQFPFTVFLVQCTNRAKYFSIHKSIFTPDLVINIFRYILYKKYIWTQGTSLSKGVNQYKKHGISSDVQYLSNCSNLTQITKHFLKNKKQNKKTPKPLTHETCQEFHNGRHAAALLQSWLKG